MRGGIGVALAAWSLSAACSASSPNGGTSEPQPAAGDAGASGDAVEAAPAQPPEPPLPPGAAPLVERTRTNLQGRMSLGDPGEIRVVSVEAVEWPDPGLDCPDPELRPSPAVTPGFLIVLEVGGRTFEYHTDSRYSIVLCSEGRPVRGRP